MSPRPDHADTDRLIRCLWFWVWAIDGALAVLSLDIGPLAAGPALLLAALLALPQGPRASTSGVLTGAGLPLLFVAYVQRTGPGTNCYRTATSAGCDQHLNPVPWLVIGAVLVLAGLVLHTVQGAKHQRLAHRPCT
jgi:hypothetical protein